MKVSYRWYSHITEEKVKEIIEALKYYFEDTEFVYEDVREPKNDPRGVVGEHRPYRGFQFEMTSTYGDNYTYDREAIDAMCSSGVTAASIRGFVLRATNLAPTIWVDSPAAYHPDFVPLEHYVMDLLLGYANLLDRAYRARKLIGSKRVPKHEKLAEARRLLPDFDSQGRHVSDK